MLATWGILTTFVGFARSDPPSLDYFSLIAQVIPALLVVAAIEGSAWELMRDEPRASYRFAAILLAFMVIFGELFAVLAIAEGRGSQITFGLTLTATTWLLVAIVVPILDPWFRARRRDTP